MSAKKILLVDDDPDFVESTKMLLESSDYEVVTADGGESGLAMARKEKPDLMVLDVMMANETEGFSVAQKIPHTPGLRGLPVLLVTGIRSAMDLKWKFEPDESWLPVENVLEKPVDPERLLSEIAKALS